ncbi:MAG: AbrB/MazE/SpoVT family DNA-binding domain-containing protein [Candidatus Loosdrechtia sp.]|uniref:AbrB/MazE/SpoVT family DNA-binding domain-containing protein n=1 Tax=Candidatus Loosdrechtia sp. TaxID=3101272 RepID=UPI003A698662|nr:MAG: AbrB/MazE/SpoVT family DNA-binding domain-containing protein [Candidatus Jettenia sp. AMX2]
MKSVTVSSKGQIAIPKEIRDALSIKGGDRLIFNVENGKLVLEPVINIPRSQAWFWTHEMQDKVKKADKNFKTGNFKTFNIVKFLEELKD